MQTWCLLGTWIFFDKLPVSWAGFEFGVSICIHISITYSSTYYHEVNDLKISSWSTALGARHVLSE